MNISMMLILIIYLSNSVAAVVVVVVVLLQKTQSEIHKGCNSVTLYEKAQDNISKRVAVEKNPSTLEKYKEDENII